MWSHGSTSSSVRWRWTYQSRSRPCSARASSHRSRRKCSLHSWNVPPRRQTVSMTGPRRRSPRDASPSTTLALGSCQVSCTPLAERAPSRSSPTLRVSSAVVFWPNHWNGVNGLGTNPPTDALTDDALRVAPPDVHAVAGQVEDAERVVVGLGRQAGEEVELHPPPAGGEGALDRAVQVLLADELVDDLAHAPGAGLGGEGEAGAAGLLDLGGDADGEGVDPEAGQAHRRLAAAGGVVDDVAHHALDAGEVGGRQAGEGDLVVAGAAQALGHHRAHLVGRALAHRAGDHPRLAEPAAPGAAPEHLDVEPVVDHLGERDQLVAGVGPVGEVGDRALLDPLGHVGVAGA